MKFKPTDYKDFTGERRLLTTGIGRYSAWDVVREVDELWDFSGGYLDALAALGSDILDPKKREQWKGFDG